MTASDWTETRGDVTESVSPELGALLDKSLLNGAIEPIDDNDDGSVEYVFEAFDKVHGGSEPIDLSVLEAE